MLPFSHGTDEPSRAWFSLRFFTTRIYRSDLQNVLHNEGEARNFNIALFRGRNRRLLAAVMCKSRLLALEKVVNMHVL